MSTQQVTRFSNWMPRATAGLVLLACWLANHPYIGINHDARLYSVQALSRLLPGQFSNDLFFMYGSQESFTLFSRMWSPLIGPWGVGTTALVLLVVAHALWPWGAVRLVRVLFKHRVDQYLALAGLFALPSAYGGASEFRYGEGFLTPRIFVEAIILHALAWTVAGRGAMALAAVGVSALLHPICAATGVLVIWIRLCFGNRRWLLLGAGASFAVVGLAFAGVSPLDGLLRSIDDEWLKILYQRVPYAFPSEWSWTQWNCIALQFVLVAGAAVRTCGAARRFMQALLIASATAILSSLVGATLLKNVLISQLQVWRGLWMIAVLANMSTGFLISSLWRESSHRIPAICLIAAAWCWSPFPEIATIAILAGVGLFIWMWFRPAAALPTPLLGTVCVGTGLTIGCILAFDVYAHGNSLHTYDGRFKTLIIGLGSVGVLEWFLLALCTFAWTRRMTPWKQRVSLILGTGAVLLTLAAWDRRGYWQSWIESHDRAAVPFDRVLKQREQVLWLDGFAETWILLQRPSYFSHEQGAGALFSRQTALQFKVRTDSLSRLDPRENLVFNPLTRRLGLRPVVNEETLALTCKSVSGLDSIISASHVPGLAPMIWHAPVSRLIRRWSGTEWYADNEQDFYLYRCSDFRQPVLAHHIPAQ